MKGLSQFDLPILFSKKMCMILHLPQSLPSPLHFLHPPLPLFPPNQLCRCQCGVPVIIEGETGVGKTALVEMLSKLWNYSLLLEWRRKRSQLLDLMKRSLGGISIEISEKYQVCDDVCTTMCISGILQD